VKIVRSPSSLRRAVAAWRRKGLRVGFVPTMGALHEAHLALVRRARIACDRVVVSVFVNPIQFGPKEDLAKYPRPFAKDAALCRREKAALLYHPAVSTMYPPGARTFVEVSGLSQRYCGASRPGHFRGVATVVAKLLSQVAPDSLFLGEKDFQQLVILRRMAADLDFPVRVVGCPIVRESDGLAMSSRNVFLNPAQRAAAPEFHRALLAGVEESRRASATPASVVAAVRRRILKIPGARLDYVGLAETETLEPAQRLSGRLRLLGAVFFGNTRLIDNVPIRR